MRASLTFARLFFVILSIAFMTGYAVSVSPGQSMTLTTAVTGTCFGLVFALFLIGCDSLFSRFSLRSLNTLVLGLFFGYLLGTAVTLVLDQVVTLINLKLEPEILTLVSTSTFLFATYFGVVMTIRASDEFAVSLPFLRLQPQASNKKDVILDHSILQDVRVIDLAGSGLIESHAIIPRFVIQELYDQLEGSDEGVKARARRALDTLKKLESTPDLNPRFDDTDFPNLRDPMDRLVKLARFRDAHILTADINRVQMSAIEGVKIINIHTLANALKPIMQMGESLQVKVQRYGKEARQGVGYLEDGTMVVVNGGGDFIGQVIQGQVLSVKHTSSGRMIFCNAMEESLPSASGEVPNSTASAHQVT